MTSPTRPRRITAVALSGLLVAVGACLSVSAIAVTWTAEARAEESDCDLDVGTELVATETVRLHRAEISKGSRVTVTKVTRDRGQLSSVDLELADGHVVPKVAIATVRDSFRVADES